VSFGHSCDEILEEIPAEMMRSLRLSNGPDERFFMQVLGELRQLCSYLNLQLQERHFLFGRAEEEAFDIILVYNDTLIYHPMVVALRNNGFKVRQTSKFTPVPHRGRQVVISIPERGLPLDIMFYGDDPKPGEDEVLKIFLVDIEQTQSMRENITSAHLLFMDRRTFDVRLLIHTLDVFFERIILPEVPALAEEPQKSS
jgi:hypothetical protein